MDPSRSEAAKPAPRITFVMATRNRREQTLRSLRLLRAQSDRLPVIVVDNGSSDGTAAAINDRFPDVTVIALGANLGACARTVGVRHATTKYVAFADDDSWWEVETLQRATEYFDSAPQLGLLAARIIVHPGGRLDPMCAEMARSPLPRQPDVPGVPVLGFVACGAVVRRSAYLQVGGFSEIIFFGGEETVLAQDLAAAGWSLSYVDDVIAHHHPLPGSDRGGRNVILTRNSLLSSWLRRPESIVMRDTLDLLRQLSDANARRALAGALRRLPAAMAARHRLPEHVERQVRLLEEARG